jgi:hypothetical protein
MILLRHNKAGMTVYYFHVSGVDRYLYKLLKIVANFNGVLCDRDFHEPTSYEIFSTNFIKMQAALNEWQIIWENYLLNHPELK